MAKKQPEASGKPLRGKHIKYPCVSYDQGGFTFVLFAATGRDVFRLTRINQREEDSSKGYQRGTSPARRKKVSTYIDGKRVIPTSIFIAFEHAKLSADRTQVVISNRADAGWVIDGQHRLAGAYEAKKEHTFPIVGVLNMQLSDQIESFVTINKTQVGVPTSLYYDLLKDLPPARSEKEAADDSAAELARTLRQDEESEFYGRIVVTNAPRKGQLSLNNFVRKVSPLVRHKGRLWPYDHYSRAGILNNLYCALKEQYKTEYSRQDTVFFGTLGFGALIDVLPVLLDISLSNYNAFRVADIRKILSEISHVDPAEWRGRGTGSAAERLLAADLNTELQSAFAPKTGKGLIKL